MQCRARPLFHGDVRIVGAGAHELRLGAVDIHDWVEADGLRHHAAPPALECAENVRLRFRGRRRRKQERILELYPGERYRSIHGHTASQWCSSAALRAPATALMTS